MNTDNKKGRPNKYIFGKMQDAVINALYEGAEATTHEAKVNLLDRLSGGKSMVTHTEYGSETYLRVCEYSYLIDRGLVKTQ